MEACKFIWMNGEFIKWEDAKIHVLSHTLHYGGGAFEGIRFYKTDKGPAVFRLDTHIKRLFYSSNAIKLEIPFSEDEIIQAAVELVSRNELEQGYIRPIVYYGYGPLGVSTKGKPTDVAIACWRWGKYLAHDLVDIKISEYIRIHPDSTISDAKLCGHYLNSIFAVQELWGTDFHEALLLDHNGYVAEGPGENFFIVKDGVVHTPRLGSILAGITRNTVIELCRMQGLPVVEKDIMPQEAYEADEAFFTGTAAEINPIRSIDKKVLGDGEVGPVSKKIRETYLDIVYGRNARFDHYLTYVK